MCTPLLFCRTSYRDFPPWLLASSSFLWRLASISCWAFSQSSSRSMGLSVVPPETKPEDIPVSTRQLHHTIRYWARSIEAFDAKLLTRGDLPLVKIGQRMQGTLH